MNGKTLGIDISKDKFDVYLISATRRRSRQEERGMHRVFQNNEKGFGDLLMWLEENGVDDVHACMEATSTYGDALAMFLHDKGFTVSVVNPFQIKSYRDSELRLTKTDRSDAAVIARFCRSHRPAAWKPLKAENRKLRDLTNRLEDLEKMLYQEKNRLKRPGLDFDVRASIEEMIGILENKIKELQDQMKNHVSSSDKLKKDKDLLCTIPGIGEKTAMMLMGMIGDFNRFDNCRKIVAWAGLAPSIHQSGTSVRGKPFLPKRCMNKVKRLLYMPTLASMRYNPLVRELCDRLKAKGKKGMQIVMAAMQKLLRIAYGVQKHGLPFYELYCEH
jgi:transposase